MTRTEAIQKATSVDGWLTPAEAGTLYDLARDATGPIIEIGSHWGRSTAALALGSMAGDRHPVYAVDPFVGVPALDRKTAQGENPGRGSSSAAQLRANLDSVGVNGLVRIIPKASRDALDDLPPAASVLFIDGDHDYPAVAEDITLYGRRLAPNGTAMFHDVTMGDPGVVRAVDELVMADRETWRVRGRVDSAVIAKRGPTERRTVFLALPGSSFHFGALQGAAAASQGFHDVSLEHSGIGWDDMNILWARAINAAENGEATHFAMLHSDVTPEAGWLDTLIGELEERGADLISTVIPIKDARGLTSTGIGDPHNRWSPLRRFTLKEVHDLPATFSIADTAHPDLFLLHNTGCMVLDLRNPLFRATDAHGNLRCLFDFPTFVGRGRDGKWCSGRESEDWFFSRAIAGLGARTLATRVVPVTHRGGHEYSNARPWGKYEHDEDATAWKADLNRR